MSTVTLFFLEGMAIGAVIAAAILCMLWWVDIRDRDQKSLGEQADAYERGYEEGYEVGGRFRFRERCQIARQCRELEKIIQEMRDDC